MKPFVSLFLLFIFGLVQAQKSHPIRVGPYLQDAEPESIKILWETENGNESLVEWGLTPRLGQRTEGSSWKTNFSSSRLHEVQLTGLRRFTVYYYRVRTGSTTSDIFQFRTPPFPEDHQSFQILAMSDMQHDQRLPGKFAEIVHEGVLPVLRKRYSGKPHDDLAMVMIAGDLVADGHHYYQWKEHFFDPARELFAEVPVYPVPGNHERNSTFYFNYFSLPENGDPGHAEHWWYKDYGNLRIIGLDSNQGYEDLPEQREWLQRVLDSTAQLEHIDFVFAQLHHPHKSELWIPGERESTGVVVRMLEGFTQKSGKPSLHFFGHTHAYSRGQSRDHKHLWINVATAGGAIDNWGDYPGQDYDQFSYSDDDYGFVLVDVHADRENPSFTLRRISRGNEEVFRENLPTDSITVYKNQIRPSAPGLVFPRDTSAVPTRGVTLKASPFESLMDRAFHAASHWQVARDEDFKDLVVDSWKQFENWYYKEDRQHGDDLTDEFTGRLESGIQYYWRVRYRDQHLNWSDWSTISTLKTQTQ